jgi:hypothetical protein
MKSWQRMPWRGFCGRCGRDLAEGDPVLMIVLPALPGARPRCVACAGEPVNPAALVDQAAGVPLEPSGARTFQRIAEIARDVTRKEGAA